MIPCRRSIFYFDFEFVPSVGLVRFFMFGYFVFAIKNNELRLYFVLLKQIICIVLEAFSQSPAVKKIQP